MIIALYPGSTCSGGGGGGGGSRAWYTRYGHAQEFMELGAVNVSANELRRMVRSSMKAVLILCTKTEWVTRQTAEGET